jgi:preprotein translocase subunit SecA
VLSHVELRVQPEPAYAMAGGEPEMAMADERATGTTGRPIPPPRAPRRTGNGADRGGPRPVGPRAPWAGTPRNAPCPCGSGKKFKHCHGRV